MSTDERTDPRWSEGTGECFINYTLPELWDLIDRIRSRVGRYIQSQEEAEQRAKGINTKKTERI